MFRFLSAVMILAGLFLTGCEDECFDYYPHHETPTTQPDEVKSGTDYYGGHNHHTPIIIPGSGSATNPSSTAPTTSSGLP
jgi:hypothetical protein